MIRFISLLFLLIAINSFAATSQIAVTVKGMVCGFCAQGINKKFKEDPRVASVDVSLEKKLVAIKLNHGKEILDSEIESALRDAGYNVEKIERK